LDNRWEAASVSSAGLRRRFACVLSLDVVGYSRMMARNDMVAVAALGDCRTVIEWESRNHGGRIFGTAGDGFMLELPDAVAAVRCAFAIQKRVFARNKGAGEDAHIWLRAGIASGSVIDDAGNLFGDVVNIAARLQETCPSGGILVSREVSESPANGIRFRRTGELRLKHIPTPIELFEPLENDQPLGVIADGIRVDLRQHVPGLEGASVLAVLPLRNDTGDPSLEVVARGFSEDLILALSHTRQFPVVDRNSSFAYRSVDSDICTVGRKLGASYVLSGRLCASRVEIGLFDVEIGDKIWSDQFLAPSADLLTTLADMTVRVAARLGGTLDQAQGARFRARRESRIGTRGLVWRSRWHLDQLTRRDSQEALRLLLEARDSDPADAEVRIQIAHWHWIDAWTQRRSPDNLSELRRLAEEARTSDPLDSRGHLLVGLADILLKAIPQAQASFEEAIRLNPSLALGYAEIGSCRIAANAARESIPHLQLALRLNPHDYYVFYVLGELAIAHCMLGEWDKAIAYARQALHLRPAYWNARMSEITALVHSGELDAAAHAHDALVARTPAFSRNFVEWLPFQEKALVDFFWNALDAARKHVRTPA
jgi:adenylate cyclase